MTEEEEKEAEEKLNKCYYTTFHSPEGQVVLKHLLDQYYRKSFMDGRYSSNELFANEGARHVMIEILARIESVSKQPEDT